MTLSVSLETFKSFNDGIAQKLFRTEFGYNFTSLPPESLRYLGIEAAFMTRLTSVGHFSDTPELGKQIEHELFSGLDIPFPGVRAKALKETVEQFKSILKATLKESSAIVPVENTYISPDQGVYPIRQNGLILALKDDTASELHTARGYIYMMTVFYESELAEQKASRHLWKELSENLCRVIGGNPSSSDGADLGWIKHLMDLYATQEFARAFRYEYKGSNSIPPNRKPGGKVAAYAQFFQSRTYPVEQKDVEEWMDSEVFKRTGNRFPPFAMGQIYDDLITQIMRYSTDRTPKTDNHWYAVKFNNEYHDPSGHERDIQQHSIYVYALGGVTYNEPNDTGDLVLKSQRMMIYYLGVR